MAPEQLMQNLYEEKTEGVRCDIQAGQEVAPVVTFVTFVTCGSSTGRPQREGLGRGTGQDGHRH